MSFERGRTGDARRRQKAASPLGVSLVVFERRPRFLLARRRRAEDRTPSTPMRRARSSISASLTKTTRQRSRLMMLVRDGKIRPDIAWPRFFHNFGLREDTRDDPPNLLCPFRQAAELGRPYRSCLRYPGRGFESAGAGREVSASTRPQHGAHHHRRRFAQPASGRPFRRYPATALVPFHGQNGPCARTWRVPHRPMRAVTSGRAFN